MYHEGNFHVGDMFGVDIVHEVEESEAGDETKEREVSLL